jgi:hemerythrin superfamily protein
MNVVELLKKDHKAVDILFQKVNANQDGDNTDLFEQIRAELEAHTHAEETVFYPYLEQNGDEELKKITKEGIEEHRQAKMFLKELSGLKSESEKFEPKMKVLMEDIKHHVQEEEGQMFPMVEEQFNEETLRDLGEAVEKEKAKFQKSGSASA